MWTKSACVVLAWSVLLIVVMTACRQGSIRQTQANIRIASSGQVTLTSTLRGVATPVRTTSPTRKYVVQQGDTLSGIAAQLGVRGGWPALYAANRPLIGPDPNIISPGTVLVLPGHEEPVRYTVAVGDTLSGIAAALAVRGGWPALYAANRRVIGPDPGLIHPGTVLAVPATAPATAGTGAGRTPSSPGTPPGQPGTRGPAAGSTPAGSAPATAHGAGSAGAPPAARGTAAAPAPSLPGTASPAGMVPAGGPQAAGIMPRWLKATLLAVALLTVTAFIAPPALAAGRRRGQRGQAARNRHRGRRAARQMARVIQADHERLIVTYSISDDTVYLLTPPGEDPRAVLRAARLVLPEDTYEELAGHLGVPSGWQRE